MTASEYNKCVDLHSHAIFRFAIKKLRNTDDAKEIVQISFEKLWMKHQAVAFDTAKSYLFTTAYHSMVDGWRSQKTTTGLEYASNTVEAESNDEYTGTMEVIEKALQRISNIQRTVILLRDYEGYSYDEIGEITGLKAGVHTLYLLSSHAKLKESGGNTTKQYDDFNLNNFIIAPFINLEYEDVGLYMRYPLTNMFKTGQGANSQCLQFGITLKLT